MAVLAGRAEGQFDFYAPSAERRLKSEAILKDKKVALEPAGLNEALRRRDDDVVAYAALDYVRETGPAPYADAIWETLVRLEAETDAAAKAAADKSLTAEQKDELARTALRVEWRTEPLRMLCLEALFRAKTPWTEERLDDAMRRIRRGLFERELNRRRTPPLRAFAALIAAHREAGVPIKTDLIVLATGDRLAETRHLALRALFQYYGDGIGENEARRLMEKFKDDPAERDVLIGLAQRRGMLAGEVPTSATRAAVQ